MKKSYIIIVILAFLCNSFYAQTGVFYYKSSDDFFPNSQIEDIIDDEKGNLLIICSNSDDNFRATRLSTMGISNDGKLLKTKNIEQDNLYDILKIIPTGEGNYTIYGNTSVNKELSPITIAIDESQQITNIENTKSVYSTSLADVYALNNSNAISIYTRKGKDNRFGIEISKVNTATKSIAWLKQLNEINNEEANDIMVSHNEDVYVLGKRYDQTLNDYNPILYKITENGETTWSKQLEVPINFNNQCISTDKAGNAIYACGYTRNQTGGIESRIIKLDKEGNPINKTNLKNFSVNGILRMSNGNFLLYGSTFYVNMQQVVTKGKYIIVDSNLDIIGTHSLTKDDKPDVDLPGNQSTSSELLCAYELKDDRIAIGGKVYMPVTETESYNQPLIIICSSDGKYK